MLITAAVACGSNKDATAGAAGHDVSRVIDVTARDNSFDMGPMRPIGAGPVTLRLHNTGTEDHQVLLARLRTGATADSVGTALRSGDEGKALGQIDFTGGSNTVAAGASQESTSDLAPGDYLMLCLVPGPDGVPHVAKGMVMPFQVIVAKGAPNPPAAVGEVRLHDYGFTLPAGFGKGTYKVTNDGPQPHELTLVRLAEGRTAADVGAYFTSGGRGSPPFTSAGGVGAVTIGTSAYGHFDLAPGNYLALCYVPDGAGGMPHAALGMVQPFSVK